MAKSLQQQVLGKPVHQLHNERKLTQADAARAMKTSGGGPGKAAPPRSDTTEFGRTLRRLRQERGLTQRELAERIGEPPELISRYEMRINYHPSPRRLAAIARALEVAEAELARFLPPPQETTLFGKALRELREQRGLTRARLAKRCRLDPALLRIYEVGRAHPSPERLNILAAALRVPRRELRALVAERGAEKRVSPFGKLIRKARIACGMTQRELAQETGLRAGALATYETSSQCPAKRLVPQIVERLAKALELDPALLEKRLSQPQHHVPTRFGHRLRQLRIDRGLSQNELASRIGRGGGVIYSYERGRTYPKPGALPDLAAALEVEEEELARLLPLLSIRPRPTPFGNELRRRRTERGLTQRELAGRVGISAVSIVGYEDGSVHPKHHVVAALAKALGVPRRRFEELLPAERPTTAVGRKIRQLRKQRGLTQRQLSLRVGCSQPIIGSYELGRKRLDPERLAAFAKALAVPKKQLAALVPPAPIRPGPTPFGRELRRGRAERGCSREELARRVGVCRESIARYESGLTHPDLSVLATLADALGIARGRLERLQRLEPGTVELGKKLQRLRERRKLTRRQLAERLGWGQLTVMSYELGRLRLEPVELALLARVLGVPQKQLKP